MLKTAFKSSVIYRIFDCLNILWMFKWCRWISHQVIYSYWGHITRKIVCTWKYIHNSEFWKNILFSRSEERKLLFWKCSWYEAAKHKIMYVFIKLLLKPLFLLGLHSPASIVEAALDTVRTWMGDAKKNISGSYELHIVLLSHGKGKPARVIFPSTLFCSGMS